MAAADGSTLHYRMIVPAPGPGRRYPAFVEHYGGPSAQLVTREWMKPFAQYLVSKGWIYFQIDNRGSANRGRAFEDQGSEEHTSELQSLMRISSAVFCLKKKKKRND